ncbi:FAD-dependent monooxygenase [Streptomyces sp. J2-1]|uniref:FAD-dependent monooxygenase n=1 Tax=Streptomyces corallincola TaxID=2851888 RepID=UPI001C385166|nr:FAD-dependent monooxygenase [Streptomyces corallincola]MBV2357773.1 FAD-dependent monooxygenase [Streptomyces corallincola]
MDPVIVVGAGPVGLTLALALARQDVPSVVLDEGHGPDEVRPARTVVLREDTAALLTRLSGVPLDEHGTRWAGWISRRRKQVIAEVSFDAEHPAPLHIAQHTVTAALRAAVAREPLVELAPDSRLDAVEQERSGVSAHTRGPQGVWWRGSHLVGCDGPRSTVRKLQDIRFPGRTGVERHAVATLRAELPWQDTALLHRSPPWRQSGPPAAEISARPLPDGVWRLDWLLPPGKDLVTPDVLIARVRETLAGWNDGTTPPYDLLDTGVHTVHHRLARRWRVGRVLLAGDAAHLLGALGTQGLDEGLRDADNLAWKLGAVWHQGHHDALLDSYQTERRAAVAARLRAADQALPVLRGGGGLRAYVPGSGRGHDSLLMDGHLGRGPIGGPGDHAASPLAPRHLEGELEVVTRPGAPVEDVRVTAEDGSFVQLRERLGRGALLVLLVAPGTGVWERRHWVSAGVMPRLAAAVTALPHPAELLVAESYPGAPAHSVLLIRPDGHLVTALSGVRPADLYAAAEATLGGSPAPADEESDPADETAAGSGARSGVR